LYTPPVAITDELFSEISGGERCDVSALRLFSPKLIKLDDLEEIKVGIFIIKIVLLGKDNE